MATKKIYSLYLCVDGLISKRMLCPGFKNMSLEDIDQFLTHFSDVYDFVSKSDISINKNKMYSLVIMSSNSSKLDVLFAQDRDFYERQIQKSGRVEYNNDLLDRLYKYLFDCSNNKRIKESPIFNHFRNVLKNYANANGEVDFVHLNYKVLNWGFNCVRSKAINNYRIMHDIYCYLKSKGLLKVKENNVAINSSLDLQNSQVRNDSDYYLYVKNNDVTFNPEYFFQDKVLVYSGSLKEIDEYTFTHPEIKNGKIFSCRNREFLSANKVYSDKAYGLDVLLNDSENQAFYDCEVLGNKEAKTGLYYWLNLYFPLASTSDSFIRFFDQYYYDKMMNANKKLDRNYLINEWWNNLDLGQLSYEEIRAIYFAIKKAVCEQEMPINGNVRKRKRV